MTLYLIHADAVATLASDDPVVPAAEVAALNSATEALVAAGRVRADTEATLAAASSEARTQGYDEGLGEGRAAAAAETSEHLATITRRAADETLRMRSEVSQLALEVVRRIAVGIGEPAVVAGLAERAAADLLPDAVAAVRVSPSALDAVTDRLADHAGLTVIADPALAANDCVFETALGVSHAGLDTQLAAVERAWQTAIPGFADAK